MRYFLDTEFIEYPPSGGFKGTIDLISIGIVSEDGREYYAISSEFDENTANKWVRDNVIDKLDSNLERKKLWQIREDVLKFAPPSSNPEFWAYYANYDWVVFCWIFGSMIDLPDGYPMFCMDLKQVMHMFGMRREDLSKQNNEHDALDDARWLKESFDRVRKYVPNFIFR